MSRLIDYIYVNKLNGEIEYFIIGYLQGHTNKTDDDIIKAIENYMDRHPKLFKKGDIK